MLATRRQWREQPNASQAPRRSMVESGEMTNCLLPPIMLLAGFRFCCPRWYWVFLQLWVRYSNVLCRDRSSCR